MDFPSPTNEHVEPTYSETVKFKTKNAKNTKFTEEDVKNNQTNPQTERSQSQPANDHQTKLPIFVGSYQLKGPSTTSGTKYHPSLFGKIIKQGSTTQSARFFQALLKGRNRALLTLFSPHHCGIIIRNNIADKELDVIDQDDTTATILLPKSDGTAVQVKAHMMPQTLDLRVTNLEEGLTALSTQSYQESTTPHKTHPHIDGHADIIIGVTHKYLHPKPTLHQKTNIIRFQTCLQSHSSAYKYCAEGIYHRADVDQISKTHTEI